MGKKLGSATSTGLYQVPNSADPPAPPSGFVGKIKAFLFPHKFSSAATLSRRTCTQRLRLRYHLFGSPATHMAFRAVKLTLAGVRLVRALRSPTKKPGLTSRARSNGTKPTRRRLLSGRMRPSTKG